jgi:putative glutamine amidotransferase
VSAPGRKPIIGVTSEENANPARPWAPYKVGHSYTYMQRIIDAGGVPLLLPITTDEAVLRRAYELLDGLCLTGGYDIGHSEPQDFTDRTMLHWALADRLPMLTICRGMQLLNLERGGTIYDDIATEVPGSIDHESSSKKQNIEDLSHALRIEPGSKLGAILGTESIGANAHHHQAVNKLGEGVTPTAWAQDDIIEGLELPDYPFVVGVQLHPESLARTEPRWQKLFDAFVAAATKADAKN